MKPIYLFFALSMGFLACNPTGQKKKNTIRGLSPEEAMQTFEVAEGFQIEQIAAEPLISDPVAMEIDEFGRLYVVEMHGYPLDKSGSGAVKLLEDTDGDGIMDKSTVFADKLVLPTGVMRWKKGIIVTDPPNVLYLEDTDGDGKADKREIILTGFALANPQHNVNNPLLGIDNWIYLGHEPAATAKVYTDYFSDRGSDVYFPAHPDGPRLPTNALGRSVRFHPEKVLLENLSSQTQFGHTFDQWGNRFLVSNAHHIYHEVVAARYLSRNKSLLVSNTIESISDHGNAADVYPITKNPEHQLLTDLGVFTAACGITAYTGSLFPSPYEQVTFVAEPVGNLVHADILREKGPTFIASRLFEKQEFLASTDSWFRPVNMYVGPDGALYVLDYYRQIIEHPEWMADDVGKSDAVYNGVDQGRIYRITPKGTPPASWSGKLTLGEESTEKLVSYLSNSEGWWRKNAQRLLIDRNDKSVIPLLEKLAVEPNNPLGNLHALWTLHGLSELKADLLIEGLRNKEAGVRENAIRMSEDLYLVRTNPDTERVVDAMLALKNDPSGKVRYQLLASLGYVNTNAARRVRNELLFNQVDNPWMQIAALSAVPVENDNLLETVLQNYKAGNAGYASLVERLSNMAGARGDVEQLKSLIRQSLARENYRKDWTVPVVRGITQSLRNKEFDANTLQQERELLLTTAMEYPTPAMRRAAMDLLKVLGLPSGESTARVLKQSVENVKNTDLSAEKRSESIRMLMLDDVRKHLELFQGLITPNEAVSVQATALSAIHALPDSTISVFLVEKWPTLTPGLREQAIGTFLGNESRISILLDALENKIIDPSVISWPRQVGLMANGNEKLRLRARSLLSSEQSSKQETVKEFQEALTLTGNPENGQKVFAQHCAICHQIGGKNGVYYGPDLATIRNRRPESVMADILVPNLSIADGYDIWNIDLKSGETLQGLIASETPSAITIRNYGGSETTIARSEINALTAMGTSVMTSGFDQLLSQQEMADLLAFLRQPQ